MNDRPRKYGNKRTWEHAIDAVEALGGKATIAQVKELLTSQFPNYNEANAGSDLNACSVNCESRGAYTAVNGAPRRTDMQHPGDKLYKHGRGKGVYYESYRPVRHGVWELYDAGTKYLAVRRVLDATEWLLDADKTASGFSDFDPENISDARERISALIVRRKRQEKFRSELMAAYSKRCCISDCAIEELLEAAHIQPYMGEKNSVVTNGLLLRVDLHRLFDRHLIFVDTNTFTLKIHPILAESEYAQFEGRPMRAPILPQYLPNLSALNTHAETGNWLIKRSTE